MTDTNKTAWRKFGSEIRRLRLQSRMTLEQVAPYAGVSAQMIGAMERGTRRTQEDIASKLDTLFATHGALMRHWSSAVRREKDPEWYEQVTRSEEAATEIHMYHPNLIPGLLQTEQYAEAVFRESRPLDPVEEHKRLAQLRVQRLGALQKKSDPKLSAVIPEGTLRAAVDSATCMREQRAYLLSLAKSRAVKLLAVPRETPYIGALSGPFRVIASEEGPPILYAEHTAGGAIIDDHNEVARLQAVYRELLSWALPPLASIDLIHRINDEADND